jgi:hypothetical protein
MFGASRLNREGMATIVKMDFPLAFQAKMRNNSINRQVMSMEISMKRFLDSIKPTGHDVIGRHEALGQAVLNMRDYTRI